VFHEEDRMYYALERLWKDCPVVPLQLPVHESAE
jgi:ribosome-associated protein